MIKKRRKAFSNKKPFEVRHYIAKRLVDDGITPEKFNKLMGIGKYAKQTNRKDNR